ncbi:NAD(P)H-quinone oxidoreductase [Arthrobacter sp. UCD-GKA]|uniref:NAD(P)H-quinone oxidoreductase n=1 Tax=Arthrobacter sp. UCD-GKA TaxID=1913576 RepID=UPI0008DE648F|nr:NAD(P)H-quinone oxidoreductase [Arthrobacter sp. UCD-GKA]OIH84788.1 NAD(P)H-quinone oxidoreductase [Arthrobacter sp. UCD-GKA]
MRAIEYRGAGGPEVLTEVDRPMPVPGPGEVLIKVAAFGLNRADVQQRRGVYPPPPGASDIPGLEVSGTVESLGEGTGGLAVGQRVCALLAGGGYAQYVAVAAGQVLSVPETVDLVDAAGFMEVACTVVSNLFLEAGLARGDTVLLHGGAGGIGSMAIQLAVAAGAKVLVTASSEEKIAHCLALGATAGINYREEDFAARTKDLTDGTGADVILDVVGAKYLEANVRALAKDGTLLVIGLQGGAKAELNLGVLMAKRARVVGTTLRARPLEHKAEIVAAVKDHALPMLADGRLALSIDRCFPFTQARSAHEYFDSGKHTGKIIVKT